jgi:predicted aldo/keto reductase-like oxidoreductase
MKRVRLGRTDLEVARIAFGGIPIQRLTEAEAIRVVQHCIDVGVSLLDTANGYTNSEERIGKAIAGRRDQVLLATKTGARDTAGAMEHLDLSLTRLGTDRIDLWQLHGVSTFEDLDRVLGPGGAMEAAQSAKDSGKVRHIGITSHSLDVALKATASGHFETIQFPFNVITSEPVDELVPLAREHDVGFIAMKPMAGGMLNNAGIAIKYLLQFKDVVPDPGIETPAEIDEIVAIATEPWELTPEERAEMQRMREELGTRFCRRCQYCEPCPEGVPISLMMNLPSFHKRFPADRFFGGWIAEAVDQARNCVECGECEAKCPYGLTIPDVVAQHVSLYDTLESQYL